MNKAQKQIIKEWRKGHNKYMEQKEKIEEIKKCQDCGCIPKNDEWYYFDSIPNMEEKYCFDCGGEAWHEYWVDYAQRKMEL